MKMSAFPLPVSGYPNLTTTQLLMSAAGGLTLPSAPSATSPKELSVGTPGGPVPGLAGRVPGLPDMPGMPGSAHNFLPAQFAAMAGMADPRILYSALGGGYDMKDNTDALMAWRHIAAQAQAASAGMLPYDTHAAAMAAASFPYAGYPGMDLSGVRRKNATRETTSTLKAWLYEHRKNPYPTKGEKIMLAIITKMTLTQVSTWFANARRRLKKENKMTWSPRNRTDDGSDDGDDKADDDAADDDVSIDLSDFESETSPQKPAVSLSMPVTSTSLPEPLPTSPPSSIQPQASPSSNKDTSTNKPRIWSIADVAANKPTQTQSTAGPIHSNHLSSSVRHRPYPLPSAPAFRPWFDNAAFRQMHAHPMLGHSALIRPMPTSALRVPQPPVTSGSSAGSSHTSPQNRSPHSSSQSPVNASSSSSMLKSLTSDKDASRKTPSPTKSEASDH